jgi:hypothetical protein
MLGFPPAHRAPFVSALVGAAVLTAWHPGEALSAAALRADGMLIVDGKPFFPVGLVDIGYWRYPTDWNDRIRQSKANLVWDVDAAYADTIPSCAALVDSAVATGYKLLVGSGDTWNWDDLTTPQLEVNKLMYETADIPTFLGCLAAAPGQTIAFANRDEPEWTISRNQVGDIDSAHVVDTYAQLHQDLSADLVAMNFGSVHLSKSLDQWKSDIGGYLGATDIVMNASYPYPAGPGTCSSFNVFDPVNCSMDRLITSTDTFLTQLNHPGQPVWNIVQAHKGIPLKEMRWEAHASIVHGVTGLLWAGWTWYHTLGTGWDIWDTTVQVMNEVAALQPYLVGVDRPVTTSHPDVEARAKRSGRKVAVIVISRNGFSGQATIQLPDIGPKTAPVAVAHEGRFILARNGAITDRFSGYESHVYEYQIAPGQSPDGGFDLARFRVETSPNPAPGAATIRFQLPREAATAFTVYDTAGRRVASLGRGTWEAGESSIVWNGRDADGRRVAPGVYFVRGTTSDGDHATARVTMR